MIELSSSISQDVESERFDIEIDGLVIYEEFPEEGKILSIKLFVEKIMRRTNQRRSLCQRLRVHSFMSFPSTRKRRLKTEKVDISPLLELHRLPK